MENKEMELYHVHTTGNQDNKWIVNNTIKVTKDFDSKMFKRQQNFCQNFKINNGEEIKILSGEYYITNLLNQMKNAKVVMGEDFEMLKKVLEMASQNMYMGNFFKNEMALENCRKEYFADLPSRLHSIYLCDKDSLEYWSDQLYLSNPGKKIEVYKVLVDGTIFKSNEDLLPYSSQTYSEAYQTSFSYWHPKFKNTRPENNEYLCQGNIKVLEKIK